MASATQATTALALQTPISDSDGRGDACDGDVGYYDTMQGEGVDAQVEPIFVAGKITLTIDVVHACRVSVVGIRTGITIHIRAIVFSASSIVRSR